MLKYLLAALIALPTIAQAEQAPPQPTPTMMEAAKASEERGALMFSYDQAAWHATDRLRDDLVLAQVTRRPGNKPPFEGYVAEPDADGTLQVTFYSSRGSEYLAFARYRMKGSDVLSGGLVPADGDSQLSPLALRMIVVRTTAIETMRTPGHGLCTSRPGNTLILPPDPGHLLSVYVLSSTSTWDHFPAGGHYRFDFDANNKLVGERKFMNSCIDLDTEPKDGKRPETIFVTHLLDVAPTEVQAFISYNVPVPLMIGTVSSKWLWGISKGRIVSLGPIGKDK